MKSLFFILTLLYAFVSFASSDCSTVNLITQKSSPFQKIPVYDQDGVGICYAYAASQLADYHLIKKGQTARNVHPLWAAMKYAEAKDEHKITAGLTRTSLSSIKNAGNCSYEKVEEAIKAWGKKNKMSEAQVIKYIELEMPKKTKIKSVFEETDFCRAPSPFDPFKNQYELFSSITSRAVFSEMLHPYCSKLKKVALPEPKTFSSRDDDDYLKQLNQKLDRFKEPVSISYCSKVLYEPKYRGLTRASWKSNLKYAKDCGYHESVIVGKKSIAGSCHYLLRNTWGSGFSSATRNWNCLCKNKKTGAMVDDCNQKTHNTGEYTVQGCWISGNSLKKNVNVLTTLN